MTTSGHRGRILFAQYTNPAGYPPLQHAAEILAEAGWDVHVVGLFNPALAALKFSASGAVRVELLSPAPRGWRQKLHLLSFVLHVLLRCIRHRPLWLYASDALSTPAAVAASWIPGVRVVYHEHDVPVSASPTLAQRAVNAARIRLLRRAALVVVPNAGRLAVMRAQVSGMAPSTCVWNCPRACEASTHSHNAGTDAGFWLVYHGSIVPARVPLTLVDALALLPIHIRLRIAGYETAGHPDYTTELRQRARQLGVSDRLEIRLVVPTREALLELVRESHVGLALMPQSGGDINEQNMTGASNKAFEYLAQGVPLLVTDRQDWTDMFVRRSLGRACDPTEPASIARAVAWFAAHEDERQAMGERGRQLTLTEWNYERQFAPVQARLSSIK